MIFPVGILLAMAPVAAGGPSPGELATTIRSAPEVSGPVGFRAETIRSLRCTAFVEEPTEYRCRFQARAARDRWQRYSAIVARDGEAWILLSLE